MRLLNIILTVTREHKNLELTLDSIKKIKKDKDVRVIILSNEVNLRRDVIKKFNFDIILIQSKKKYGALYNEALEKSKSEYITFIDAGDVFDTNGLGQTVEFLKNNKPNIVRTDLAESYLGLDGKPAIGIVNYTYVETPHGHYFKNEFLKENGLAFNDKLNVYSLENFYRNAIYLTSINCLKLTTYLSGFVAVKYDNNHLPKNVENIDEYYESLIDTFEHLQKKNNENYKTYILSVVFSIFIIVESVDFSIPTLQDKKRYYEEIIYSLFNDFKEEIDKFDDGFKNSVLKVEFEKQRRTNINIKITIPFMTLIDKMSNIHSEYDNSKPHFLDIIIPEYEGEEFIFDFFDSLARQKDVNFDEIGVIVINDDSPHKIKPYKFKRYGNLNIDYIVNEKNIGQGMTRQHGIDVSKAEYVTMFDQDDTFYDEDDYCLSKVITELKKSSPNVLLGNVIEQNKYLNGEERRIVYKSNRPGVFIHGFYFKRQFLIEKNYRFHPDLRQLEDTYFTRVILATTTITPVDVNVYFWRNNRKSQVRNSKNDEVSFTIRNFDYFALCGDAVYERLKDENTQFANNYIIATVFGLFLLSNSEYALPVGEERIKEMQKIAYEMSIKYKNIFDQKTKDEIELCFREEQNVLRKTMPGITPFESFDDFIARMEKLYPNYK